MSVRILQGDCLEVMPTLDAESIDAIICDPPYGLAFMGKAWDHGVPGVPFWTEALRVAKPGAYLVAAGGTRTFHRLTVAIEDAGWEIRDCLSWLYGSGFPKSLDVSKAIDKAAGAEREVVGPDPNWRARVHTDAVYDGGQARPESLTAPFTAAAKQWTGWGTALKPAWEPIIMARKPLTGTVASNVQAHGTGAINIDACRISYKTVEGASLAVNTHLRPSVESRATSAFNANGNSHAIAAGRWPANVCLDDETASLFPESRFFYTSKASRSERNAGLEGLPRLAGIRSNAPRESEEAKTPRRANHHPTVKPIALMRWLCRLVTPPNGLILDPFMGSGSTGVAATLEGFRFVGIEKEAEYLEIARARIDRAREQLSLGVA